LAVDLSTPGLIFIDHRREYARCYRVTQQRGSSQLSECRRVLRRKHLDRKLGPSCSNAQFGEVVEIQELFRMIIFTHHRSLR
jgi:hypothetical protein